MEEQTDKDTFYLHIPVVELFEKSEGEGKEGKRCVKGYASTEALDKDKEQVLQKGMDFEPLQKGGFINYDHKRKIIAPGVTMPMIIGVPTLVEMRSKGLWVEGELMKATPEEMIISDQARLANEMWVLGTSLQKSGQRSLAYSIEGGILERRGNKVARSVAKDVALTHKPVNAECSVEVFAKSLCCGKCSPDHPQYNPAHSCSNKKVEVPDGLPFLTKAMDNVMSTAAAGQLLKQNLDRGMSKVLYGDERDDCYNPDTGRFKDGLQGAVQHMTDHLGYGKHETIQFLRKLIEGAGKNADLSVLVKTAGLTG